MSDLQTLWFTSDLHLSHDAILKHQPWRSRQYGDIATHDAKIIDRINECVREKDVLWVLGDFAFFDHAEHFSKLRCNQIHLIRGNHDRASESQYKRWGFQSVRDLKKLSRFAPYSAHHHDIPDIILCHYAMHTWVKAVHGAYHLYGHSHGSFGWLPGRRMDVGWDVWAGPVSLETVHDVLGSVQCHGAADHHPRTVSPSDNPYWELATL